MDADGSARRHAEGSAKVSGHDDEGDGDVQSDVDECCEVLKRLCSRRAPPGGPAA